MSVHVTIGNAVSAFVSNLAEQLPSALERGVMHAAQETVGIIRKQVFSSFPSGRTGNLARSYKETLFGWKGSEVSAGAVSDLSYADIQDRGGTIFPRSTKYLAVPVGAGRNLPVGKWPRHFSKGELTFIRRKGGDPILARVSKGRVQPMFVLKSSVTLRGRNYLDAARATAEPVIAEILGDNVSTAVDRVPVK